MPKLPYLVSRLFFVAAIILLIQALFPALFWWGSVVDLYSTVFIPIDGSSVGAAAFLLILGGALARRKRVGWIIAVVAFSIVVAADILLVVGSVVVFFAGQIELATLPSIARFGFNLAALGSLLVCMVVYRSEFSAHRQPGSVRKGIVTLVVGLLITFGTGMILVTMFPGELVGPRGRLAWMVRRIGLSLFGEEASEVVPSPLTSPPTWINTFVGLLVGLTLFAALIAVMRSQRRAAVMSADEEPPGLVATAWPGVLPRLDDEVASLADLIHRVEGPAVVVGHSMAGLHAEALARMHPELVAGVVLVDSSVECAADPPGNGLVWLRTAKAVRAAMRIAPLRLFGFPGGSAPGGCPKLSHCSPPPRACERRSIAAVTPRPR